MSSVVDFDVYSATTVLQTHFVDVHIINLLNVLYLALFTMYIISKQLYTEKNVHCSNHF